MCAALLALAADYRKPTAGALESQGIRRDDLRLVCFEYLST
jgi:hypothetical protein